MAFTLTPHLVSPGDVLVVRDAGFWAWWIRFGERLRGKPHDWNHVVIAHHVDAAGTFWGIEGRPGGVGWRDLRSYLGAEITLTNRLQGKSDSQRASICQAAEALLGVRYDWPAIVMDGLRMIDPLWQMRDVWGPGVPGQIVCSSLADYIYERVGLVTPATDRWCTPGDWAELIESRGWDAP